LQNARKCGDDSRVTGQKHTSLHSSITDPNCPLCVAWVNSPCERAFSSGVDVDPIDAHRMLILGYFVARADRVLRPVCSVHRKQLEKLELVKNALEQNEALGFKGTS
jgi:hypothetical protein